MPHGSVPSPTHHESEQHDLFVTNVYHHIGIQKDHASSAPLLGLFPELTPVCSAIVNIFEVFPEPNQSRIEQPTGRQRSSAGRSQGLNQQDRFYFLPLLTGQSGHEDFPILLNNLAKTNHSDTRGMKATSELQPLRRRRT